eukprot:TRINITY_DN16891_c2_g2_i9.p1 TRINITY_DN16891_c2_g2~~TRINITY_DN16891_c2_g2_i9.p1  ORF type:complete len:467 (+),score=83.36 TRINITY_DN16891_c2_g2_i9:180-1580(+)
MAEEWTADHGYGQLPSPAQAGVWSMTLVVLICSIFWFLRKKLGPRTPSCDFEAFYWEARRRLGRSFHTYREGNQSSKEGTDRFAWAVPNKEALSCIARYVNELPQGRRHIVDFGAGSGYWSLQVKQAVRYLAVEGVQITALDKHPELYEGKEWHPLEQGAVEALKHMPDAAMLLLIWPPCWEDMALKALQAFSGDVIVYIGEGRGGCTAWTGFFDELEDNWEKIEVVQIPNWHGRFDSLSIHKRKSAQLDEVPEPLAPRAAASAAALTPASARMSTKLEATRYSSTGELLLPFFQGSGKDVMGRSLAEIREFDFEMMERSVNYVPWMFPTDEVSMHDPAAPRLNLELKAAFNKDEALRQELRLNLSHFCSFLGLDFSPGDEATEGQLPKVTLGSHFQDRVPCCWSAMFGSNHNWLRISRVLHCLGLCSMPREQKAFLSCLESIAKRGLADCSSAMPHWQHRGKAVP